MLSFISSFIVNLIIGSLVAHFVGKVLHRKKCEGSHLIEGCGKIIYPINRYTYIRAVKSLVFKFLKFNEKDDSDYYKRFYQTTVKFRNAQYETLYCCLDCYEKHENLKIANILTDERHLNDPYDFNYYMGDD